MNKLLKIIFILLLLITITEIGYYFYITSLPIPSQSKPNNTISINPTSTIKPADQSNNSIGGLSRLISSNLNNDTNSEVKMNMVIKGKVIEILSKDDAQKLAPADYKLPMEMGYMLDINGKKTPVIFSEVLFKKLKFVDQSNKNVKFDSVLNKNIEYTEIIDMRKYILLNPTDPVTEAKEGIIKVLD